MQHLWDLPDVGELADVRDLPGGDGLFRCAGFTICGNPLLSS